MEWLRRLAVWRKLISPPPATPAVDIKPDEVLASLIDAASRNDSAQFVDLCNAHALLIFEHFAHWQTVPQEMRGHHDQIQARLKALVHIATLYEQAGHPELMATLTSLPGGNPLPGWERRIQQAHESLIDGRSETALEIADALLGEIQASGFSGNGVVDLRARAHIVRSAALAELDRHGECADALRAGIADAASAGLASPDTMHVYRRRLASVETRLAVPATQVNLEIEILETFALAQRRSDLRRYEASNTLLAGLLDRHGEAPKIVEHLRPHILGRMGYNEYRLGRIDSARQLLNQARELCAQAGKANDAEVYEENLNVIDRSLAAPRSAMLTL